MKDMTTAVEAFHKKIGNHTVGTMSEEPNLFIRPLAVAMRAFSESLEPFVGESDPRFLRAHLLIEELSETLMAMSQGDELETLDGLTDLLYVLIGTAITFDFPLEAAFWDVQKSNMTKEPQPDDVSRVRVRKKGPNFVPPNLAKVLGDHRNEL